MRHFTLTFIVDEDRNQVLLGRKKLGAYGIGILNGPGGHIENDESPIQSAVRETEEEFAIELDPAELHHIGVLICHIGDTPDAYVHVFWTNVWKGEPAETDEMIPAWVPIDRLPYEQMLEGSEPWMPQAMRKELFTAHIFYTERAKGLINIELTPYQKWSAVY